MMTLEGNAEALVREALACQGEFRPCAWFDSPLDCIRIVVRDCSHSEIRINRFLTVLEANYSNEPEYIGFTLKGMRHLCKEHGIRLDTPVKLAQLFDVILRDSEPLIRPTYYMVVKPLAAVSKAEDEEFDLAA